MYIKDGMCIFSSPGYKIQGLLGKLSTTKLIFQYLQHVTKLHKLIYLRKSYKCDRDIVKFKMLEAI